MIVMRTIQLNNSTTKKHSVMKANAHNHLACEKVQQFFFHNCEPTYLTFRSRFQMGDTTIYSYMYVCGIFPTVEDFKCVKQNSLVSK